MRPPTSILLLLLPLITITASASLHSSNSLNKRHLHDHSHPPHRDVLKRLGSVNDAQVQEKDAEKDWSLGGVLGMVEEGLMGLKEKRQLLGSPDDDEVTTTSSTTSRPAVATSRTTSTPPLTSSTPPTTSSPTSSSTTSSSSIRSNTDTSQSNSQGSSSTGQTSNTAATGSGSISTSASGSTTGSPSGSQVIPSGASNTSSIVSQSQAPATHTSTDAQGSIIYITQIETLSASSTNDHIGTSVATVLATDAAGANTNGTSTGNSNGGGGMSTGAIVGISVVGGVAVLGIVLFVVWKMKQKRFSGFDDDDVDGIKWPELNKHGESDMHLPLPAKPTGNHGFETDALDRSKTDLDGNRIDGDDDYEPYSGSQPISYANSINGHYPEEQQQYNMGYASTGVYGPDSTNLSRAPSVAATYLSGNDASTVGLDRSRSLGGTRAFDVEPDAEMMEMTGQKPAADMSRDGSSRLH